MLYYLLRPFTRFAFLIFYRKIHIVGKELIPAQGPVLFACNHTTAFIDPCLLACFQPRILHFITRGDVFKHPVANFILRAIHMLPIFRFKDGYGNLKNNAQTFEETYQLLHRGAAVIIMAEGGMAQSTQLREVKKGPARMIYGALEKYPMDDIQIIPVAINYSRAEKGRSDVSIIFQKPISAKSCQEPNDLESKKAILALTLKIRDALSEVVVHIDSEEDESLYKAKRQFALQSQNMDLFYVWNSHVKYDRYSQLLGSWPMREIQLAEKINHLAIDEKKIQRILIKSFIHENENFWERHLPAIGVSTKKMYCLIILILFLPIAVFSFIIHWIPTQCIRWIVRKFVPVIEFKSSVQIAVGMIIYPLWYLLLFFVAWTSFPFHHWFWYLLASVSGLFLLHYQECWMYFLNCNKKKELSVLNSFFINE